MKKNKQQLFHYREKEQIKTVIHFSFLKWWILELLIEGLDVYMEKDLADLF